MSPRCRVSRQKAAKAKESGVSQQQSESDERLVQVWFGAHVLEEHLALPDPAQERV